MGVTAKEASKLTVAKLKEELAERGLSQDGLKVSAALFVYYPGCWGPFLLARVPREAPAFLRVVDGGVLRRWTR